MPPGGTPSLEPWDLNKDDWRPILGGEHARLGFAAGVTERMIIVYSPLRAGNLSRLPKVAGSNPAPATTQ
jgi:hypothetical protein